MMAVLVVMALIGTICVIVVGGLSLLIGAVRLVVGGALGLLLWVGGTLAALVLAGYAAGLGVRSVNHLADARKRVFGHAGK